MTTKRVPMLGIACTTVFLSSLAPVLAGTPEPDRETIRAKTKAVWDSLDTFECVCDLAPLGADGRLDRSKVVSRYEWARASGARSRLTFLQIDPAGEEKIRECYREDGRRRYTIQHFQGRPGRSTHVTIDAQAGTADFMAGTMFCLPWLLMPDRRPVYALLDKDASVQNLAPDGSTLVLTAGSSSRLVRCKVDSTHGWLAKRVDLEVPSSGTRRYWEVSRFSSDNGRWFPVEGTFLANVEGQSAQMWGFEVLHFTLNRAIDPAQFTMPTLPDGVTVHSVADRKDSIIGGRGADNRLLNWYAKEAGLR
jgi:hypothetical protein